jgi:hypothetical protein
VLYSASREYSRLSALSAPYFSARWYNIISEHLLRSTISGGIRLQPSIYCAPLSLSSDETTADSLLRSTMISCDRLSSAHGISEYLLRLTIFCTPLHSVYRNDCRPSAAFHSISWYYIKADYLLRSHYPLHLTLPCDATAALFYM